VSALTELAAKWRADAEEKWLRLGANTPSTMLRQCADQLESALAATGEGGAVVPVEVTAQDVIDADDVFATSDGTAQQAADIINARLRDRAPNTVECPTCGRVSFGSHVLAAPAPDVAGVVWDGEAAVWEFVGYLSARESLPPTRQDAYAWQDVAREFLALRTAPPAAGGAQ
jgi:hypothetical protein